MKLTKWIAALLAMICLLSLCACTVVVDGVEGGENKENNENTDTTIDLGALKDKMIADLAIVDSVDVATDTLLDLYGIETADVASSACFMTMDGVFPDEVIMIEAKDADAAKRVAEKLNARLEDVKKQSESYDADNYALAQKCSVKTKGVYVTLFLSPKYAEMTALFNEAAK